MNKFSNKYKTADGEARAFVELKQLKTLWFNTGTLCNITCANCYIESSPSNDRLVYLSVADVRQFLDEIAREGFRVEQLGFTGGEPFMNPAMNDILEVSMQTELEVLVLTNAMQPLMRPKVQAGLVALKERFGAEKLIMRVSLDSYRQDLHDDERGAGAFAKTLEGLRWLSEQGFRLHIAGRQFTQDDDETSIKHYQNILHQHEIKLDERAHPFTFFTEMDEQAEVPEITTKCWDILSVHPDDMMCASSRMVVKYKGDETPSVIACTLLPYAKNFNLGDSLKKAHQSVYLNHTHCAKFCVLGGSSCS